MSEAIIGGNDRAEDAQQHPNPPPPLTDERFYTPRAMASSVRSTGSYGTPRTSRSHGTVDSARGSLAPSHSSNDSYGGGGGGGGGGGWVDPHHHPFATPRQTMTTAGHYSSRPRGNSVGGGDGGGFPPPAPVIFDGGGGCGGGGGREFQRPQRQQRRPPPGGGRWVVGDNDDDDDDDDNDVVGRRRRSRSRRRERGRTSAVPNESELRPGNNDDDDNDADNDNVDDNAADNVVAVGEDDNVFSLARHGRWREVESLLAGGTVHADVRDDNGNTILSIGSQNGSKRIVKLALRYGANINACNYRGNTALHFSYRYGFGETLGTYLITKGANQGIRNRDGRTCLECEGY